MNPLSQILPPFEIGTRRFRLVLLGLALALAVSSYLWIAAPANADEGNIQVVQVGAESRYPQGVRFFVTASSPDEINEIRLFFKKTGRVTASAYRALEFDSGDLVNAESILSTGAGLNYMPPGTEISYFLRSATRPVRSTGLPIRRSFIATLASIGKSCPPAPSSCITMDRTPRSGLKLLWKPPSRPWTAWRRY